MNSEEFANIEMKKRLAPKVCPLPRIGSKEWGWTLRKNALCMRYYCSDKTGYCVSRYGVYSPGRVIVSACRSTVEAKRVAELLARRDWRRENRGKK